MVKLLVCEGIVRFFWPKELLATRKRQAPAETTKTLHSSAVTATFRNPPGGNAEDERFLSILPPICNR